MADSEVIDLRVNRTPGLYTGISNRAHKYLRYRFGNEWYHDAATTPESNRCMSVPPSNSLFWKYDVIRDPRNCISNYSIKIADIPSNRLHKDADLNCIQNGEIRLICININKSVSNIICPRCNIYFQSIPISSNEICLICYNYPFCKFPLNEADYQQRWRWNKVKYIGSPCTNIDNKKQATLNERMSKKSQSFYTMTSQKRKEFDDDEYSYEPLRKKRKTNVEIICICGSKLMETTVKQCYPLHEIVECNECDMILNDKQSVIYHCNNENICDKDHKDGYDLCKICAMKQLKCDGELYCICRKAWNGKQNMICCDFCDEWYHITCVGVDLNAFTAGQYDDEDYKCVQCMKTNKMKTKTKKRKRRRFKVVNSECNIIKHKLDETENRYKFKIETSKNMNAIAWFYGDEIDISKIQIFAKYLKNNSLQCVESIIGHKQNFMNETLFRIKWKGFKQGFDEWRSAYDLIGASAYLEYCKQNDLIGDITGYDMEDEMNIDKQMCKLQSYCVGDGDTNLFDENEVENDSQSPETPMLTVRNGLFDDNTQLLNVKHSDNNE